MELNLNRYPYFEDFDPSRNYLRIIFRPGRSLQVRELNNLQSIFNEQIKRFSSHFFKNGARVNGARMNYFELSYIIIKERDFSIFEKLQPGNVVLSFDGVKALIVHTSITPKNEIAIFFRYISYNNENKKTFAENDVISIYNSFNEIVLKNLIIDKVSKGKLFQVDEGVFFFKGNFIENNKQIIVVSYDTNPPKYKIGFDVIEEIVDYKDHPDLLDNAIGFSSFRSPGSDRYKISLSLTKRRSDFDDSNFIILAKITELGIQFEKTFTEYAEFNDFLAKRTYEESGNYTLSKIKLKVLNHKANSPNDPFGLDINGDPNNYAIKISPHISYVNGYRIERNEETVAIAPRGDSEKTVLNERASLENFSSFIVYLHDSRNAIVNINNSNYSEIIDLYDGPIVSDDVSGEKIGEAEVIMVLPEGNDKFRYVVDNVKIYTGKSIKSVKSLIHTQSNFLGSVDGLEILNWDKSPLIIKLSKNLPIKTTTGVSSVPIKITTRKRYTSTINSSGLVSFNASTNESFNLDHDIVASIDTGSGYQTIFPSEINVTETQISFNAGISNAGKPIIAEINTIVNVPIKTKILRETFDVFTNIVNVTMFELSKSDIFEIIEISLINVNNPNDIKIIDKNHFSLFNGQTPTKYINGKLTLRPGVNLGDVANYTLKVSYKYLEHSLSEGAFVVDSYQGINRNQIPSYISPTNEIIKLSNAIDFRPLIINNTIVSPSLRFNPTKEVVFNAKISLPRMDLVAMNKFGEIYIRTGIPSENPVAQKPFEDDMGIFELFIDPNIEGIEGIIPHRIENRRYTMKEIGGIEKRIKSMEYYTALTLLEKSAESMVIKDSNGFDRFKNGFVADDFSKYQAADIKSNEFRASLDRSKKELRPSFIARHRKLKFNKKESSNCIEKNGIIMIDYDEVEFDKQPFATKNISINPYLVTQKKGVVILEPNIDTWADVKNEPDLSFSIDSGVQAFRDVANSTGLLNTEWGAWREINRTTNVDVQRSTRNNIRSDRIRTREDSRSNTELGETFTTTTTTRERIFSDTIEVVTTTKTDHITEAREGIFKSLGTKFQTETWENVTDVKITPFIRPITIHFKASGLVPKTKYYIFFDGKEVTNSCRPENGDWKDNLISNENGELDGFFRIHEKEFFVGEKDFIITTTRNPDKINDPDENYSFASTKFFAGGLDVSKQKVSMNIITPVWQETRNIQTRRRDEVSVSRQENLVSTSLVSDQVIERNTRSSFTSSDPVAQSFTPPHDLFITSIELYFATLDPVNTDIWVSIRRLENGYPTSEDIAIKRVNIKDIKTSDDSSIGTKITFDHPVFCEGKKDYCFVVGGASPGTRIWVARMSDPLINDKNKYVETQPTLGSSFRSQNGGTWTAEQFEDIKYILYCAKFKNREMKVVMNQINEFEDLPEDPFEGEQNLSEIRIYAPNHGFKSGDKFTIKMFESELFTLKTENGQSPVPGMILYTSSGGRGEITDIEVDQKDAVVKVKLTNITGRIKKGDVFTCDTLELISNKGNNISTIRGTVVSGPIDSINGIPVEILIGEHSVYKVDSQDTFLFKINSFPANSGRFGGKNVKISCNTKYDAFNINGSYMSYGSDEKWSLVGVGYNSPGGIFEDDDYREQEEIQFIPGTETFLNQPYKIANDSNENENIKSKHSVSVNAVFTSNNEYISPILNINTFNIIAISNQVDWIEEERVKVGPFASSRYKSETTMNGLEPYKYVTRQVSLSKPARDLVIAFEVYKDKDADFDVYFKLLYSHETKDIDSNVEWVKVPIRTKIDSLNHEDKIDYEITLSEEFGNNWSNKDFTSFKIKLVGRSKNSAKPPIFKNFRAIAIT